MIAANYIFPDAKKDIEFSLKLKPISREVKNFREEILLTVTEIANRTSTPLYISYGGGMDSEIIIEAFLECKIPFTVVSFTFCKYLNLHDITYAYEFCKRKSIKQIVIDLNPFEIYKENLINGNKILGCWWSYVNYEMIKSINNLGGSAVLGIQMLDKQLFIDDQNQIYSTWGPGFCLLPELFKNSKIDNYSHFYCYKPELIYSYINDPIIIDITSDYENNYLKNIQIHNKDLFKNNLRFSWTPYERNKLFKKYWPEIIERPKYDGYEKIRKIFLNLENTYKDINISPKVIKKYWYEIRNELNGL